MRITRVHSRKGDGGTTGLGGGQRVPKHALRVLAYGMVDELNSIIGLALASGLSGHMAGILPTIQNELFHLGSDLCVVGEDKARQTVPQIQERHVRRLESLIEKLNEALGPLKSFILPGGSVGSAHLHVARAVCRRAERVVIELSREEGMGLLVIPYLNRLSDLFFVMARFENKQRGMSEAMWDELA